MRIEILRAGVLIGDRSYNRGETPEVPDAVGYRHVRAGSAVPAPEDVAEVETADAPSAPETAQADPGRPRRRA